MIKKLMFCLLLFLPLQAQAFFGRNEFSVLDDFTESSVLWGIKATEEICASIPDKAVWAKSDANTAECIKYWHYGLSANTGKAVVFFHGDIIGPRRSIYSYYPKLSGDAMIKSAHSWSQRMKAPYIFIGRPGTHGSSGDHTKRRTLEEVRIISAALDALAKKYGIKEFVLAGQSGGGHSVSSLLTVRDDIVCAVPTSAVSSPKVRFSMMGANMDTTNYESYEPIEHFKSNRMRPDLRVVVLGDPRDSNVFWESQTVLIKPLTERGVPNITVEGEATGGDRHSLSNSSRHLAGLCYHKKSFDEIKQYLGANKIRG